MKKIILLSYLLVCGLVTFAQTPAPATKPAPAPAAKPAPAPAAKTAPAVKSDAKPGSAIGVNFSTNGVGIQFARDIGTSKLLAFEIGASYLPYSISNMQLSLDGTKLNLNGDIKLGAINAMIDFYPMRNAFKFTAGLAYMLTEASFTASPVDSAKQGDIMISPEEQGIISIGATMGPIVPYVGIGFGRAVPKKRFSFNFEMGAYYINQPNISFKTTGMLEPTSTQQGVLQSNVDGYNWLPMMNMGFNFKISK
jgi:hypothetical protein